MRTVARVVGVLVALSGAARSVWAQYPQRRDGFWIGFGLGYGAANVSCDNCRAGPRTDGVTGFLKLGGAPSQNLLIGGAITSWSHSSGGATETMANLTGSLYFYPRARSGFFFTGGLGLSGYHVNTAPGWDGTGWGLTLGAGYDIRVGRDVSLTPVVNYLYGAVGDVTVPGTGVVGSRWRQDVIDVGLGVTFH
jgi:hypothetical protein